MKAKNRLLSLGGMLMIGDALAYVLGPRRHIEAWRGRGRVRIYSRLLNWFERHPAVGRAISVGELIAGAALIRRAESA